MSKSQNHNAGPEGSVPVETLKPRQTELLAHALQDAGLPAAMATVGRPVAYLPALAGPFGGAKCAILICQLFYWRPRSTNPEDWVYKSSAELQDETGLTYEEQRTARRLLRNAGVLEERHRRLEHRVYFRLNMERLAEVYRQWQVKTAKTPMISPNGESPFRELGKAQLAKPEMPSSGTGESPVGETGNPQFDIHRAQTESTAEMTSEETNQQTGGSLVGSIGAAPHQQRDGEPAGAGRAGDGTGGSLVGPVVPAVPAVLAVPSVPAVPAVLDESGPGQPGEPPAGLAGAPPALTAQEWFARITRPADFVDFYHSYLRHRHPGIRIRSKLAYDLENSQECLGMIEVHGDDDEQLPKVALNWMVWHSDTQVDPSDSATTTITALKNSWWDYRRAAPYRDGTHWGPFVGAGAETESLLPAAPAAPAAEPPPAAAAGSLLDPGALVAAYRAEIQQQRPDYQPPERVTAADREEASRMLELLRGAGRLFEGAVKCWISSYVHQELGGGARLDCNTTMHALRRSWPNYRLLLPRAARPAVERPAGLRETVTKELQNNLSVPLKSAGVVVTANLLAESCGAGKAVERIRAKLAAARPDSLRSVYAATCVFEPERWPAGTLLADWRERFAGLWEKIDRTPPQDAGSRGGEALTAIAKAAAGSGDTMARSEPAAAV